MSIFTRAEFWIASGERAIKTAAQTAIATIGTDAVGVTELDWAGIGGVVATATILSVLFSVASGGVNQDGPGIGPETVARPAAVEHVDTEHGLRAYQAMHGKVTKEQLTDGGYRIITDNGDGTTTAEFRHDA